MEGDAFSNRRKAGAPRRVTCRVESKSYLGSSGWGASHHPYCRDASYPLETLWVRSPRTLDRPVCLQVRCYVYHFEDASCDKFYSEIGSLPVGFRFRVPANLSAKWSLSSVIHKAGGDLSRAISAIPLGIARSGGVPRAQGPQVPS